MFTELVSAEKLISQDYVTYAMSVLRGRAIPDYFDGLKPIQRRILVSMFRLGLFPGTKFAKAARVTGDVMGKYSPHGDCYPAIVNLAQPWKLTEKLVDGHGNWGSPTDGPAAQRYTECRLTNYSHEVLLQNQDNWEQIGNYDDTLKEPIRLIPLVPNLLVNGSEGIGVGYSTKIPPHNLKEVVKATLEIMDGNYEKSKKYLIPDFPTGCQIIKDHKLIDYINSGKGSIKMRASYTLSKEGRYDVITFTNLPFQTNIEKVCDDIKSCHEKGRLLKIRSVRDESDREGTRLLIILKTKTDVNRYLYELFRYTSLEKTFSANTLVIKDNKPCYLSPVDIISAWLTKREATILEEAKFRKDKINKRLSILYILLKAIDNIDEVIKIIRGSLDLESSREGLKKLFPEANKDQIEYILDMKLRRLNSLEHKEVLGEKNNLESELLGVQQLINSREKRLEKIRKQIKEVGDKFGHKRFSKVIEKASLPPVPEKEIIVDHRNINLENGLITASKKGLEIEKNNKIVIIGANGMCCKRPYNYKGPAFEEPSKILEFSHESDISKKQFLVIFKLVKEKRTKINVIRGKDLCATTSKGKRFIPKDSEVIYFSEEDYKDIKVAEVAEKRKGIGTRGLSFNGWRDHKSDVVNK